MKHYAVWESFVIRKNNMPNYFFLPGSIRIEEGGERGWTNIPPSGIIGCLPQVNSEEFIELRELMTDKRAAYYSIPNPWASAYMFAGICESNVDPFRKQYQLITLNMVYDILYNDFSLEFFRYNKNIEMIWKLAPPYIKFMKDEHDDDEVIPFILDPKKSKIVGGLSKRSLVWCNQNYRLNFSRAELLKKKDLFIYLGSMLVDLTVPIIENIEYKGNIISHLWCDVEFDRPIDQYEIDPNDYYEPPGCVPWFRNKKPSSKVKDRFFKKEINKIVVDSHSLKDKNNFGEKANYLYEYYYDKSKDPKNENAYLYPDALLPYDKIEVCPVENLVNKEHILVIGKEQPNGKSSENSSILDFHYKQIISPKYGAKNIIFTAPIHIDFLKANIGNINGIEIAAQSAINYALIKYKYSINEKDSENSILLEKKYFTRAIGIWPPFPTPFCNTFAVEYKRIINKDEKDSFNKSKDVVFYDKEYKVLSTTTGIYSEDDLYFYKYYRFDHINIFPKFIELTSDDGKVTGIFEIIPREKMIDPPGRYHVSIDFGSSHTTVMYQGPSDSSPIPMTFLKSRPLIIVPPSDEEGRQNISQMLQCFFPDTIEKHPPQSLKDYEKNLLQWFPFQTIWKHFGTRYTIGFINKGLIPLSYPPQGVVKFVGKEYSEYKFERDIKWNVEADKIETRNDFLDYLLQLILIECEARNANSIYFIWSYPLAFDEDMISKISSFWAKRKEKYANIGSPKVYIEPNGIPESYATLKYFINECRFLQRDMGITIDIGGKSTDIAFFKACELQYQNSIKFAGTNLTHLIHNKIIRIYNTVKPKSETSVQEKTVYEDIMRLWPALHNNWRGELEKAETIISENNELFREQVCLFYGGICYYIGLFLKAKNYRDLVGRLAFAGNGIKFLYLICYGLDLESKALSFVRNLFAEMFVRGHNIDYRQKYPEIIFSKHPKEEVARGSLSLDNKDHPNELLSKIIGLDLNKEETNALSWKDWKEKLSYADISNNYKIDFSLFKFFLIEFYGFLNKTKPNWNKEGRLRQIDNPKTWDDIDQNLQSRLLNYGQEKIHSPIFFAALETWLEYISAQKDPSTSEKNDGGKAINEKTFARGIDGRIFYDNDGAYLVHKKNDRWALTVREEILNKIASLNIQILVKPFFDIAEGSVGKKCKKIDPASIRWNAEDGQGDLIKKGTIYLD